MALAQIIGTYTGGADAVASDILASLNSLLARVNDVTIEQMGENSVSTTQLVALSVTLGKIATGTFTADGTGRGKFANEFVNRALQNKNAKGAGSYIRYEHKLGNGVDGGTSSNATWNNRLINTLANDAESLSAGTPDGSGRFTLPAGDYRARIWDTVFSSGAHVARLQNVTAGTTLLNGTSEICINTSGASYISGNFTVAASQNLQVQHYTATGVATTGLGFGVSGAGINSVFCVAEFWKIGD